MDKVYRIAVFGKPGCPKCQTLNKRIDKLLAKDEWSAFEKKYYDVETIDGLVAFSESECVNPQRIPAMLVMQSADGDEWKPMANSRMGADDEVCSKSKLFQYLGLQTDYTDTGKGVISAKMIRSVLAEAREAGLDG